MLVCNHGAQEFEGSATSSVTLFMDSPEMDDLLLVSAGHLRTPAEAALWCPGSGIFFTHNWRERTIITLIEEDNVLSSGLSRPLVR